MSAGPTRLEAAARTGTPAVIAPGCLDMVNFWEPHTLPEKYRGRRIYQHNPKQTLIRTDPGGECRAGTDHRRQIEPVNWTRGGLFSAAGHLGRSPRPARHSIGPKRMPRCSSRCRHTCGRTFQFTCMDMHINDPRFARAMAEGLLAMNPRESARRRQASSRAAAPLV